MGRPMRVPLSDSPGIPPRWTSSAKEGVGTAYATASRVWFTLSHGILNEIYYPTIDRPQVRDMQFLITDGETFFHEEKRDLESTISYIEEHTLGYRIESTDRERRYRLIKEIVADPHQPCVLIHLRVDATLTWMNRCEYTRCWHPIWMSGDGAIPLDGYG